MLPTGGQRIRAGRRNARRATLVGMVTLTIAALDVDDPSDAQRVVDVFAAADAVDRPWHPGYPAAEVQVLATHGWDGDPELFFLGRDADGTLVAAGSAVLPTRDNLNAVLFDVRVVPDHRGKGVGSLFYDHLEAVAAAAGRTRFFTGGPESDAGRRFAETRGYAVASVGMTRRVDLGEVSAEAVQAAYDEAEPHAREYELVRLAGPLPTELMEAYVEAVSAINDAPLDDLEHRRRDLRRRPGPGVRAGAAVERTPALSGARTAPGDRRRRRAHRRGGRYRPAAPRGPARHDRRRRAPWPSARTLAQGRHDAVAARGRTRPPTDNHAERSLQRPHDRRERAARVPSHGPLDWSTSATCPTPRTASSRGAGSVTGTA